MAFRIKAGRPIRRELQHVVRHQLKLACEHLELRAGAHVHDARRRVKKVRAIVALLREADTAGLRKDARRLRAAGRSLSQPRDAEVVLNTLGRVSGDLGLRVPEHALSAFSLDLARAKAQIVADALDDRSVAAITDRLRAVRRSAAVWEGPAIKSSHLPGLVTVAYRAARRAMRRAVRTGDASDLHEWRKSVKALWYELRLIEECAPPLRTTIGKLGRLEALLGEHHDLFVLKSAIVGAGRPELAGILHALTEVAEAQQDAVRQRAFTLGSRILADKPRQFARALRDALSRPPSRDDDSPPAQRQAATAQA